MITCQDRETIIILLVNAQYKTEQAQKARDEAKAQYNHVLTNYLNAMDAVTVHCREAGDFHPHFPAPDQCTYCANMQRAIELMLDMLADLQKEYTRAKEHLASCLEDQEHWEAQLDFHNQLCTRCSS
jgi:hypothetical protein